MDKVEYRIRADEIKALIGEGRYAEAVKIADTIDWKRVKSVQMLCTISDLYKINRRYTESRDVLLMAYDRHPTGRLIVYSLCELAIKMGEFVQAVEYYKEFVRIAPRDTGRYILQYKLYEAQEVSLEERIAVLEEFKKHDYRERWAYELAYLYHRVGLTTECVEECDEMFLWFGEGRHVMKALELKALHEPLSPEQQDRYLRYKQAHGGIVDATIVSEKDEVGKDETRTVEIKQPTKEMPPVTDEVIEAYNRGEVPQEEDLGETREFNPSDYHNEAAGPEPELQEQPREEAPAEEVPSEEPQEEPAKRDPYEIVYPPISEIKEPSFDVSSFNTTNLQAALAEGLREVIGNEESDTKTFEPIKEEAAQGLVQPITEEIFEEDSDSLTSEDVDAYAEDEELPEEEVPADEQLQEEPQISDGSMQEVFAHTDPRMGIEIKYGGNGPILGEEKVSEAGETVEPEIEEQPEEEPVQETLPFAQPSPASYAAQPLEEEKPGAVIHPNASYQMHNHFESMLSQEYDGQISMAVEPEPAVEKQITGQISIAEYMANWEQFKKEQQQKQFERIKQRVSDETGDMFADYDEKTKAGLQEKIEKAINEAIKKERHEKASGRGDWSVKQEDVINAAVEEVMDQEGLAPAESYEDEPEVPEEDIIYEEQVETKQEEPVVLEEPAPAEPVEPQESLGDFREVTDPAYSIGEGTDNPVVSAATSEDVAYSPAQEVEETTIEAGEAEDDNDLEPVSAEAMTAKIPLEEAAAALAAQAGQDISAVTAAKEEKPAAPEQPVKEETKPENKPEAKASEKKKHHIGNRELEERVRTMTPEEKELFGPYIHHKKSRRQIINAIDNMSMDAFSGNAIVTGEEGAGTVNLAKGLIKAMQVSDSNFSGKVAKITANTLNKKSTAGIFEKLANGALIIQRAADLEPETVSELLKILQEENKGLVIVMEDTKEDMDRFLDKNPSLKQSFNVRVDIEALDDDSLVAYARQYALEREYAIDNLGILALHTRISERQTLDHDVTVSEVKDIVDDAIYYAEKKSVGHLVDVLVNKRYDENDMIILREKDFMHD
ncbi:tetratricopeptide repeat protein [Butyrivibrio sp. FCS014]|uniref:tetratricopeptide repeat protein n=1 Tax=Butyrivibrio sp. FCS014 TaxID=1408304 RepID=UPI00046467CA|nr:hypothetical protein [Butyrivibrio sp. FCS014]